MRIIKIDDEEIELYVIKYVDGKKLRIPVCTDENEKLDKTRIPDDVIMVKSYGKGVHKIFNGLWNRKYEYAHAQYVETSHKLDDLLVKLEKYDMPVFSWENGERLL